jgi:NTP pyrophosphatase (non-canonical NTP hydrolase)
MDAKTTLNDLKRALERLRDERDWKQFHNPKDLGEQIAVEAGELLELFLWQNVKAIEKRMEEDSGFRKDVEREFADILLACFSFANATNIDISIAVLNKLEEVKHKYPIKKAKGVATKYNKL